jgi:hypothetical protein
LQGRCVKYFKGHLGNASLAFLRSRHESLTSRTTDRSETKRVDHRCGSSRLVKDVLLKCLSRTLKSKTVDTIT